MQRFTLSTTAFTKIILYNHGADIDRRGVKRPREDKKYRYVLRKRKADFIAGRVTLCAKALNSHKSVRQCCDLKKIKKHDS